ncbi:MAG: riboflavin synthase [Candidatus Omnitrophica bacterium]|nr:riboflavin synthase [Candidatus Omnitrophota bacterium]MCM8827711.1 riboflavin synthase [Candidatus Omnitrophota bacterium]
MFAGIIEEIGTVVDVRKKGNSVLLGIKAKKVFDDLSVGDSISVDGVCLTVKTIKRPVFYTDLSPETLKTTTLGNVRNQAYVNLERALKYGTRIGGHLLSGHIDFKTTIISRKNQGNNSIILVRIPIEYSCYFIKKGSVGIDGISLTVADLTGENIAIWLIPYTIDNTTMKNKKTGDQINIEVDMLAKIATGTECNARRTYGKVSKESIF